MTYIAGDNRDDHYSTHTPQSSIVEQQVELVVPTAPQWQAQFCAVLDTLSTMVLAALLGTAWVGGAWIVWSVVRY